MPVMTFDHVSKSYGGNTVIKEFDAVIPDKEFLVLLGPSGCGKSTMLRMIAGLTDITSGRLVFGDVDVTAKTSKQRNIAFVFQSYALYPHMTVRANIAFPLVMDRFKLWHHIPVLGALARRRIMRRPEVADKVAEVAEMLELTSYLDRRPRALSGGQRQRVAVARALVREPSLYLLDEPLSNLDAKLRTQMRAEISALYNRVQKTFVYVTHDQVEAMTMGTQIIVLNDGIVQQYGTPDEIYANPANTFVAKFIGAPPMNLFPAARAGSGFTLEGHAIDVTGPERDAILGVRPERIRITEASEGIPAHVTLVEHLGAESVVGFKLGRSEQASDLEIGAAASRDLHYVKAPGGTQLAPGDSFGIAFAAESITWFDADSGTRID